MSIRYKLIVFFLLIALIPASFISIYSINTAQTALKEGIGDNIQGIAGEKAAAIATILRERVEEARILATHPLILAAVREANRGYLGRDEDEILKAIAGIDREWIASDRKSPEAKDRGNNSLAIFLRAYQARNQNRYGEIFVTDRLGATVAMTRPLTDFYQADEEWWTGALTDGLFIDDRGYDSSVNSVVVGVVVPVKDKGEITGVLKINYKVGDIYHIVSQTQGEEQTKVLLARSRGTIIMDSEGSTGARLTEAEMAHLTETDATTYFVDEHQELKEGKPGITKRIEGHAQVDARISTRLPGPGAIKGVSGEHWEPITWQVFVEVDQEVAFANIGALQRRLMLVGVAIMLAVAFLAYWIARSIANPILVLRRGAEIIAAGDLDHKVGIDSADEIGGLSQSFDRMTARLGKTLASRDEQIAAHKRAEEALQASEKRHRSLVEKALDGIVIVDSGRKVVQFNPAAEEMFGYTSGDVVGMEIAGLIVPPDQRKKHQNGFKRYLETGESKIMGRHIDVTAMRAGGEEFPVTLTISPFEMEGQPFFTAFIRDITKRRKAEEKIKASLAEKEVLLQEIHHRVKNNLQVISSMLALQARAGKSKELSNALLDSERRIRVMAKVHENLYRFDDLTHIDARNYLESIARDVKESQLDRSGRVLFNNDIDKIILGIDQAIPIGQIVSELLSNALKHAFPDGGSGTVTVSLKKLDGKDLKLSVADDGIGLPNDFSFTESRTLGLQLIDTLSGMIKGEMFIGKPPGASFHIIFKGGNP